MKTQFCTAVLSVLAWLSWGLTALAASPPADLLAWYQFSGNGDDSISNSPPMQLQNTSFVNDTLCLNGIYGLGNPAGFIAIANITGFSYDSFTVAVDFNAIDFSIPRINILSGGPSYRWLAFSYDAGLLRLELNNFNQVHGFTNGFLRTNFWHRLVCSVDVPARKIVTYLDSQRLQDINLPSDFQFDVVGTPYEESDKAFNFNNYGYAATFYGYVDNLRVYSRALSPSEIEGDFCASPVITMQPESQMVAPGAPSVTFSVVATGAAPFTYQWRLNGFSISGATSPSLTMSNVQATNSGTYTVAIVNACGKVLSAPATLVVTVPLLPGADRFTNRVNLAGGVVRASNAGAINDPGEPRHAGKLGGKSVWYTWQAPSNGIARFHTRGSTFDTLLAVYTGTTLDNLTPVASDEDRGGVYTSEVYFNATAGVRYQIAVDGHAGAGGTFVLTTELEPTAQTLPVITSQSSSRVIRQGSNVTFSVSAVGSGLTYQWFFLGTAISNATSPSFTRSNVQAAHVGFYTVRVRNSAGRSVETLPANVEMGSSPELICADKFEDLTAAAPPAGSAASPGLQDFAAGPLLVPFGGSVTTGYVDQASVSTQGTGNSGGDSCSIPANTTWHPLPIPAEDGVFCIEAVATRAKPRLAAAVKMFGGKIPLLDRDACDDKDGGFNEIGRISFEAQANTQYFYEVDTPGGDTVSRTVTFGVKLSINRVPAQPPTAAVRLSWCAPSNHYVLQARSMLASPPAWSDVTGVSGGPQLQSDRSLNTVEVPIDQLKRFFRLRKVP